MYTISGGKRSQRVILNKIMYTRVFLEKKGLNA